jgi:hypothetical protein
LKKFMSEISGNFAEFINFNKTSFFCPIFLHKLCKFQTKDWTDHWNCTNELVYSEY